jgi:hypothetical protein
MGTVPVVGHAKPASAIPATVIVMNHFTAFLFLTSIVWC